MYCSIASRRILRDAYNLLLILYNFLLSAKWHSVNELVMDIHVHP